MIKNLLRLAILLLPTFSFAQDVTKIEVSLPKEMIMHQTYNGTAVTLSDLSKSIISSSKGVITNIPKYQNNMVSENEVIVEINGPSAKAEYNAAKMSYDRDQALSQSKIISADKFEQEKVHYEKALQIYQDSIIRAPFNGKLGIIKHKVGDQVKAGDQISTIVGDGKKHLYVELPSKLFNSIKANDKAEVIDENGQTLNQLDIVEIDPYISEIADNFTIKMHVNNDSKLVHGSFVDVRVIYDSHQAITVPEQAIMYDIKGSYLHLVNVDKVIKRYVKIGIRMNDYVEILDNISLDDKVVTEGNQKIKDGSLVEIIKTDN